MSAEKGMNCLRAALPADKELKAALQHAAQQAKPGKPARGGDFTQEQRTWTWNFVRRKVWPLVPCTHLVGAPFLLEQVGVFPMLGAALLLVLKHPRLQKATARICKIEESCPSLSYLYEDLALLAGLEPKHLKPGNASVTPPTGTTTSLSAAAPTRLAGSSVLAPPGETTAAPPRGTTASSSVAAPTAAPHDHEPPLIGDEKPKPPPDNARRGRTPLLSGPTGPSEPRARS